LFSARDSGQPAVEFRSAKAPKLANLNSDYCSSAIHSLECFRVDLQEQLLDWCRAVARIASPSDAPSYSSIRAEQRLFAEASEGFIVHLSAADREYPAHFVSRWFNF